MREDPLEWDESDLNELIASKAEESLNMEFKSAGAIENMTDRQKTTSVKTSQRLQIERAEYLYTASKRKLMQHIRQGD